MGKLRKVVKKLRKINVSEIVEDQVIKNKEELIDYNVEDQLFLRGVDSRSQTLGEYSPFTKEIKEAKGQPTDRITLRDEQDFHNSFYLKTKEFPFIIDATDWKRNDLVNQFGIHIFGVTRWNLNDFIREIRPGVQKEFRQRVSSAFKVL